jgi:hypothetical protein
VLAAVSGCCIAEQPTAAVPERHDEIASLKDHDRFAGQPVPLLSQQPIVPPFALFQRSGMQAFKDRTHLSYLPLVGAIAIGALYLVYKALFQGGADKSDFNTIWFAGYLWSHGTDPYAPDVLVAAPPLFTPGQNPTLWAYPPSWWLITRLLGLFSPERAAALWAGFSLLCTAAGSLMFARSIGRFAPHIVLIAFIIFQCFMTAVVAALQTGQTILLVYLGMGCLSYGLLHRRRWLQIIGLTIVMLKPQVGLVVIAAILAFPGTLVIVAAASVASLLLAMPAFIADGPMAELGGMLRNVTQYGAFWANQPKLMTSLGNPSAWARLTIPTSLLTLTAIATAYLIAVQLRLRRTSSSHSPGGEVIAASLVAIAAFVPLHLYDFALMPPLVLIAHRSKPPLLVAGLVAMFRPENVVSLFWSGEGILFPIYFILSIGGLLTGVGLYSSMLQRHTIPIEE